MNRHIPSGHRHARVSSLRAAGWAVSGLLVAAGAFGPAARPALAAVTVTPVNTGNPTCADLAPDDATWSQFKLENAQLGNGEHSNGTLTVTISNFVGSANRIPGSFDWASNIGVDAVFVKAGSDKHNFYVYDPEALSDSELRPQAGKGNGISHISFCYDAEQTPSLDPKDEPTDDPSNEPTDNPTQSPSNDRTDDPSQDPSNDPTDEPTYEPTDDPSNEPTDNPTQSPSNEPTDEPTSEPSQDVAPTQGVAPTPKSASQAPSQQPAASPTEQLTGGVLGATGTPMVTLPPTDTMAPSSAAPSADGWRILLIGLAALVAAALLIPSPTRRTR